MAAPGNSLQSTVSVDHLETAASVTIVHSAIARDVYGGRMRESRPADSALCRPGRSTSHAVLCHARARLRLARDRTADLKVYDDRGAG
jgi:hypothetical protein